jgi:NAD(P)H-dependent flavin oxidoreductase YrpB (nitropropane dioxygenase family)
MPLKLIFMLTHNDRTVSNAADVLEIVLAAGIRDVGFKDIGLPFSALKQLNERIKGEGATSYLEVVSLDRESEIASAAAACEIGVDALLGGTRPDAVVPAISGRPIRYFPFAGRISGHPSVLEGSVEEIADSATRIASMEGVDGLDLLAYRANLAVPDLMDRICRAVSKPVIVAGSIDSPERIVAVAESGAWGFTVGTAAFEGRFHARRPGLRGQIEAIVEAAQG